MHLKVLLAVFLLTSLPVCAVGGESKQGMSSGAGAHAAAAVEDDAGVRAYRASQVGANKKRVRDDNLKFGRTVR